MPRTKKVSIKEMNELFFRFHKDDKPYLLKIEKDLCKERKCSPESVTGADVLRKAIRDYGCRK